MNGKVIALALILVIIVSAVAGYLIVITRQGPTTTVSTNVTTTTSTANPGSATQGASTTQANNSTTPQNIDYSCPVVYTGLDSPSSNTNGTNFPIVAVPSNHYAVLCVTYHDNNMNKTEDVNVTGGVQVGTITASVYPACSPSPCTSFSFVSSNDFEVLSNVSSLQMGPGHPSEVTVGYAIVPTTSNPGYYWLNIWYLAPSTCSNEFPFAYGHSFTSNNASVHDFPLPSGYSSNCITYLQNYMSEYAFAYLVGVSYSTEVGPIPQS